MGKITFSLRRLDKKLLRGSLSVKSWVLFFVLLGTFSLIESGFTASPIQDISAHTIPSYVDLQLMLPKKLHLAKGERIKIKEMVIADASAGSHLYLNYSTTREVVILFARGDAFNEVAHVDFIYAILPPGQNVEARVSLMLSKTWNASKTGLLMRVFTVSSSALAFHDLKVESRAWFGERLMMYVLQFLQPEIFDINAPNLLRSWTLGSASMSLILGGLFLAFFGLALFFHLNTRRIGALCLFFLLFYQARFMIDVFGATEYALHKWNKFSGVGQTGDAYAIASYLRELQEDVVSPLTVLLCDSFVATPLKYYAYPVNIVVSGDDLSEVSYAVMLANGPSEGEPFRCGSIEGNSEILMTFPNNGIVATFSSL